MLHALLTLAAEESEPSKVPFYIVGGAWAVWAVFLGFFGMRTGEFPGSEQAARGIMAVSAVLMVGAMATAVITA